MSNLLVIGKQFLGKILCTMLDAFAQIVWAKKMRQLEAMLQSE